MVSMKYEKELLVTGMIGTSPWELIILLCFLLPINYGCYTSIVHLFNLNTTNTTTTNTTTTTTTTTTNSNKNHTTIKKIIIEFISIWIPMIICPSTILYPYGILVIFIQVFIIIYDRIILFSTKQRKSKGSSIITTATIQQQSSFITLLLVLYRSGLLLYTIIAILSVDFPIVFPRRFVKTEVYGYSYMDIGASSFVFSSGLVSSYTKKGYNNNNLNSNTTTSSISTVLQQQFYKLLQKISPLLVMGIIRLVTHKNLEYQEHISEYGIHWNFFFTLTWLCIIPILRTIVLSIICSIIPTPKKNTTNLFVIVLQQPTWIIPITILVCYQLLFLSNRYYNGQEFIINFPRSCTASSNTTTISIHLCNIIVANREGIFGCISYSGLFLVAEKIASTCLWYPVLCVNSDSTGSTIVTTNKNKYNNCCILLLQQSILWTIIWLLLTSYFQIPVSRRSTNISFCIWTIVINVWQLTLFSYIITLFYNVVSLSSSSSSSAASVQVNNKSPLVTPTPTTVVYDITSSASINNTNKTITDSTFDTPILLNAMNRHGLLIFIISNLLTGIINLSINTVLLTSIMLAFSILIVYVIIIATIATYVIDKVLVLKTNLFSIASNTKNKKQKVK